MSLRTPSAYATGTPGSPRSDRQEVAAGDRAYAELRCADWLRRFRRSLSAWYRRHRRDLPWRKDRDPYSIWVSEVMLQQTQVATVIPYFERFRQAFPTVTALAAADEQQVLRLWEGLGYYRRARALHRAAQLVVAHHGGRLPDDPALVSALPGIGRYTVGAILSQAYDRRLPILEANSCRVLCRVFGERADPRDGSVRRRLWQAAEAILPWRGVGNFNQALMELGALVCTPSRPRCAACPIASLCAARRLGLAAAIPLRPTSRPTRAVREAGVVVFRRKQVLVVRRANSASRWAGLWEFPHGELHPGEAFETAALRLLKEQTGIRARLGPELLTIRHGVTRFRIELVCFEARYRDGKFRSAFYQEGRWLEVSELASLAFSAPQRRLARALVAPQRQRRLF